MSTYESISPLTEVFSSLPTAAAILDDDGIQLEWACSGGLLTALTGAYHVVDKIFQCKKHILNFDNSNCIL